MVAATNNGKARRMRRKAANSTEMEGNRTEKTQTPSASGAQSCAAPAVSIAAGHAGPRRAGGGCFRLAVAGSVGPDVPDSRRSACPADGPLFPRLPDSVKVVVCLYCTNVKSFSGFFILAGRRSRHALGMKATVGGNRLRDARPRCAGYCASVRPVGVSLAAGSWSPGGSARADKPRLAAPGLLRGRAQRGP